MRWTERLEADLDFILEQVRKGKTAEETDALRLKRRELSGPARGRESEQRVIDALRPLPLIADVVKASKADDAEGIDLWVSFDPDSKHHDMPVQVKSSWRAFWDFLIRQEKGERRIVIRVGDETSSRKIQRMFLGQLKKFDGYI